MENGKELPAGWVEMKLDQICEILDSFRIPINNEERIERIKGISEDKLFPYYGATGQVGVIDEYLFDGEYILLGEDGAPFLDAFKNKAYIVNGKFWVNNHAHILKAHLSNQFVLHYLNQFGFRGYVSGTTRLKLTQLAMKEIPVPLPPLAEQHRIVAKLEELFSELDKGVENLRVAQQQLKVYRQAVLQWAFEGKLTEEWRRKQSSLTSAIDLVESIAKQRNKGAIILGKKEKYFPLLLHDMNDDFAPIPDSWTWAKIEQVSTCLDSKRVPINKQERQTRTGNIPYYGANGLVGFIDDYIFDEDLILVVEDETFVGREKPFSYKIKGKAWVNNHAHVLRSEINIDFLNYQLLYYPFLPLTTGTTGRKKLTQYALMNAPIKICTLPEQQQIVAEIESRLSVCDKLEETIAQSLLQAEALRQSILKQAFAGKLVPQDPSDEPAEKLLARIRAERAATTPVKKPSKGRTAK